MSDTPDTSVDLNNLIDKLRALEPRLSEDERQTLWRFIEAGVDALVGATADVRPTPMGMFDPGDGEEPIGEPHKVGASAPEPED